MTIWERYKEKLLSPRFHQLLIAAVLQIVQHYGWIDPFIANTISTLLIGSVTIETVDKATKPVDPTIVNKNTKS